jgi:serine/threonine protein kinase
MPSTTQYRNALPVGAALHEYRIEQVLGVGGFGMTYLARDTHLDKQVAIKEYLPSDLAMRAGDGTVHPANTEREADYRWGLERFLQEARTLAKFSHPHIVRVARYFEANATAYMVMEYEHGEPLKSMLAVSPHMDEAALRRILDPILDGLAAVHATGFLHRDIKPDNIFIRSNGSPVLIDFGSARNALGGETRALTAVLTPGYAPLEQYATDGNQGPWTDLYALAGVLFQAASGKKPPDAVSRVRSDSLPAALAELRGRYSAPFLDALAWALRLDEKGRPQSVAEWRAALSGAAPAPSTPSSDETTRIVPPPAGDATLRVAPPPRRKPWLLYGAVGAVVVAAVAAFALMGGKERERREPREHRQEKIAPAPAPVVAEEPKPAPKRVEEKVDPLDAEWTAEFRNTDANKDGALTRQEVDARFPNMARNFERMDGDGDGRLSRREFLQWRREQHERRVERKKN